MKKMRILNDPSQVPPNMSREEKAIFWKEHKITREYLSKLEPAPDHLLPPPLSDTQARREGVEVNVQRSHEAEKHKPKEARSEVAFDPGTFINREAEQELFEELLAFQDDARVLTILAPAGMGKSILLKKFRHNCKWFHDPPILTSLVPLDQLSEQTPFTLITKVENDLIKFADEVGLEVRFPRFERLNDALRAKDFVPFLTIRDRRLHDIGIKSRTEGTSAGSSESWSAAKDDIARRECIKAFCEELYQIASAQPVIVLLDSWERSDSDLQEWILARVVRPLCFDLENRPAKFGLVLAGRELPDFRQRVGGEAYNRLVKSVMSLRLWEERHVRAFLQAHGYEDLIHVNEAIKKLTEASEGNLGEVIRLADEFRLTKPW
jgi:hypothetical protein